ncbi:hypothetical protein CHU98_g8229, partial [Xylaria longipes]
MATTAPLSGANSTFRDKEKPVAVRSSNIVAARAVADAIRTSLGPRGMDKMIRSGKGETIITNDGHTMLKSMAVMHPTAKMLVNLSSAQDVEAGDGTTSVVVICGALLGAADRLLSKGIHPSVISESFQRAAAAAVQILHDMSQPVSLSDSATLLQAANTSLSSKIVSQYSGLLGSMAVNAVTKTIDVKTADNVDLKNIRIIKKVGGTIEDSELVNGLVLTQPVIKAASGPVRMEKARIGLIQFQLSPPKPDMENTISVNDYRQMDKIVKEERLYLLDLVKKIKKAKCNVLLIQKSILRDAVNDLSLHFLAKLNILAVKDIERDEVEFICKSTGCKPIADIDSFTEDKLGSADLVEEVQSNGARMVKVMGTKTAGKTVSVVCRGANSLILDEAERSLHDALCVIRCLVKKKALIAGGGAPEIEIAAQLSKQARSLTGTEAICWKAFADALEIIPTTLAENAGLNSIKVVTDLRHRHEMGEKNAGVSIRSGGVNTNIAKENVLQPLLVSTSAIELAAETVKMILRIDDIALTRVYTLGTRQYAGFNNGLGRPVGISRYFTSTMAPVPSTMKAVFINKTGGPEVLEYKTDVPVPTPINGDLLVKNDFLGVNFIDTYFRTGLYSAPQFPYILGREGEGTVVAVGNGDTLGVKVGDRVVYMGERAYAEFTSVPAAWAIKIPASFKPGTAAAAFLQGLTALTLVRESHPVKKGDWVLVHAAAGGTGLLLCQLLKAIGANTIGTVSTPEK